MLCLCIWYAPLIQPHNTLSQPLTPHLPRVLVGTDRVSCDSKGSGVKGVLGGWSGGRGGGVSDTLHRQTARKATLPTAEPTQCHLCRSGRQTVCNHLTVSGKTAQRLIGLLLLKHKNAGSAAPRLSLLPPCLFFHQSGSRCLHTVPVQRHGHAEASLGLTQSAAAAAAGLGSPLAVRSCWLLLNRCASLPARSFPSVTLCLVKIICAWRF